MAYARVVSLLLLLGAAVAVAHAQPAAAPSVELKDVAVVPGAGGLTVAVTTSGAPRVKAALMDGPWRIVLDFEDCAYRWAKDPVAVGRDPVKELRGSQYRKGLTRVVIELTRNVPYALEPHAAGLRVVFGAPKAAAAAAAPSAPPLKFKLQGIVLRDDGAVAYIADTATATVNRYRVGDTLGDGVVETIEERRVVLRLPRGTTEMRLEEPRPDPRPRP